MCLYNIAVRLIAGKERKTVKELMGCEDFWQTVLLSLINCRILIFVHFFV